MACQMKYSKPELCVLGDASAVVEFCLFKEGCGLDPYHAPPFQNPAYDLDE